MNRLPYLFAAVAILLGACGSTSTALSARDESLYKWHLIEDNAAFLSPGQRELFLRTRFGSRELVDGALATMIETSEIHHRSALRDGRTILELYRSGRVTNPESEGLYRAPR